MALSTLLVTAIASMSAPPIDVAGDRRCLDAAALEARAQSWGAREAWPDGVTAHVEHTDATLTIRVDASGAEPMVRTFDAVPEACHDVELMAAVAIAMALDAVEQAIATPPPPDVARVDAAPVRPIPTVTLHDTAWSVRPVRPEIALSAALGGAQGLVPFATAEAALGVRVGWRRVALVGALELGARRVDDFDRTGALTIMRLGPTLGVCSPWARGRWTLGVCALGMAGSLVAQTRRTAAPRRSVVPWLAAALRTEVALGLSARWSVVAQSDLVLGLVRPTIAATELATGRAVAWSTPRWGWRGGLAVRVGLGRIPPSPVKRPAAARMEGAG